MDVIEKAVNDLLGPSASWTKWPGGWPGEIGTALIDSVYSARARYTTKHGKGIKPLVVGWRNRTLAKDSITGLLGEIDDAGGPEAWMARMNDQLSPRRTPNARGGPTKAAAVREAAENLKCVGIEKADDLHDRQDEARRAISKVQGVGYATTSYFMMLLGFFFIRRIVTIEV